MKSNTTHLHPFQIWLSPVHVENPIPQNIAIFIHLYIYYVQ